MKVSTFAAVVGLALVAQACATGKITGANWTGSTASAPYYPKAAVARQISGSVAMNCYMQLSGALTDCHVVYESNPGWGFGDSALQLYTHVVIQMSEAEMVASHADKTGGRILQPVFFCPEKDCPRIKQEWDATGHRIATKVPHQPGWTVDAKPRPPLGSSGQN